MRSGIFLPLFPHFWYGSMTLEIEGKEQENNNNKKPISEF
jgi:hypothetical protein